MLNENQDRRKELEGIVIENRIGVSPVADDTIQLAHISREIGKGRILDLGTGTGYIGIYLAKAGYDVDASDVDPNALKAAENNCKLNKVKVNFILSDLFESIPGYYDLIIFNPPSRPNQGSIFRVLTSIFRRYGKAQNVLVLIARLIFGRARINFIHGFLSSAEKYLTPNGAILIHIHKYELKHLQKNFKSFHVNKMVNIGNKQIIILLSLKG